MPQPEATELDAAPAPTVYIISTDCMRCGVCEYMCPVQAIIEAKRQLIILKRLCTGCGECVPYCPVRAIVPGNEFRRRQSITVAAELRKVLGRTEPQPRNGEGGTR